MPSRSSNRADDGIAACPSSRLMSLIGASARAARSAQPAPTWSASTRPGTSVPPRTVTYAGLPASHETTAAHSSGSDRSVSSRQIALIPVIRAVASTCGMPVTRRSMRAPSSTTRVRCGGAALPEEAADSSRIVSAACAASSLTRRSTVDASPPTIATQSAPCRGAPFPGTQCGSQRTQFQCSEARGSSLRTTMDRSRGLCSVAAWTTSQRASARDAAASPARPITPRSFSDSVTGTSRSAGTTGGAAS